MLELSFYKYFLFKKKEVWFYNGEKIEELNYTTYCYFFFNPSGKIIREQSCFIDLGLSLEEIKNKFSKTTKLHINRALANNINCIINYSPNAIDTKKFINLFSKFAKQKKITFNKERIIALQKTNKLVISSANTNNTTITMHCYLHDTQNIVLLHTFNLDTTNGIANKLLHWEEIKSFKENNFKMYDFGGIDATKLPGITKFKLSFGSQIIDRLSVIKTKGWYKLFKK